MCSESYCRKKLRKGIVCIHECENLRQLDDIYVFKVY